MVSGALINAENSGEIISVNLNVALAGDLLSFDGPLGSWDRDSSHYSWQSDGSPGLHNDAFSEFNINFNNWGHCAKRGHLTLLDSYETNMKQS